MSKFNKRGPLRGSVRPLFTGGVKERGYVFWMMNTLKPWLHANEGK